jgi:hypothetical protein
MGQGQNNQHDENKRLVDLVFNEARQMDLHPSPYMKTRILAELRDRKSRKQSVNLWKRVAAGCFAMALGLLIWTSTMKSTAFEAVVNQPYVVRVEMAELQTELIAGAEIELPDGVYFYSEAYPELKEKRNLDLAWNGNLNKPVLPFVINGEHKGIKEVKVKFFDRERKVIAERALKIAFSDKVGS